ncbi:hypothetical protein [Marinobacter shengliensis]|uniref:Uncharacterized protein n=1 Tax=Marinobacter shengliensis TaxID=1389223 RepID=A0ABV4W511_9GAMM
MKISMSSEKGDLKVSVSAQLQHEGFERGALVPLLAAKGGYSEAEALSSLQEMLQNTMPEALLQADSTLRIAIEERLLSIALENSGSSKNSFSELAKDYEGVAYAPAKPPTEIVVVFGEQGCGKTLNADRLAKHFRADNVIDEFDSQLSIPNCRRTLIFTNHTINAVLTAIFNGTATCPSEAGTDSIHLISFTAAMQELH